eukprot:CAMPEP_0179357966 /NCGR_PEP_ID=MMETSP0797-20121207/78679_1 /TAXON_ID=47934 /ORGANISM="Dinophysis acuminata, Strain DAEP01" /LENGTH=215 /DNA_ID=CAMNT_0021073197 /DNA_START=1 /DNA_END=649 /DNA_ORIENTATION=+
MSIPAEPRAQVPRLLADAQALLLRGPGRPPHAAETAGPHRHARRRAGQAPGLEHREAPRALRRGARPVGGGPGRGEDPAGCVVLFPSPDAIDASALAAASSDPGCVARSAADLPRSILVLDGGWRECKKINGAIDAQITRCRVTTATREEYGGTRKYGTHEKSGGNVRVQTAAAFIALMQELGEDPEHVTALKAGLAHFMGCWEAQICRSKTWVT